MKFIKLTALCEENGETKVITTTYVNMEKIRTIVSGQNCTYMYDDTGDYTMVKETPEEIMEMINGTIENKPEITEEELREMMKDSKYWKDQDPEYVKKVENGFKKLYNDK